MHLADRDSLARELTAHTGLPGVRQARRALALSHLAAESPPETYLRVARTCAGLAPVPQHVVRDRLGGFLARVDLAFPHAGLAIEYDGRDAHGSHEAFIRDRQRQNALVAAGWTVLRFTAEDLHDLGAVVRAVAAALRSNAA